MLSSLLPLVVLLSADANPPPTVVDLNLQRYSGKWFDVARYPNRFQKNCVSDSTAEYTLEANGKIAIRNTCREASGKVQETKGSAKLADANGPNSKLKVTFFWPFSGDYWVLDVDSDYQWALVGSPDRDLLWILSRKKKLEAWTYRAIVAKAKTLGFDPEKLVPTKQSD